MSVLKNNFIHAEQLLAVTLDISWIFPSTPSREQRTIDAPGVANSLGSVLGITLVTLGEGHVF